jgi:hypothetical protein
MSNEKIKENKITSKMNDPCEKESTGKKCNVVRANIKPVPNSTSGY